MLSSRPWKLVVVLALTIGIAACGDDPNAPEDSVGLLAPDQPTGNSVSGPPSHVELRDPVVVVNLHAEAVSERDFRMYHMLLAPKFRFYARDTDVGDLLCLPQGSDSWGAGVELTIWKHMTSPHYVGSELPVQEMSMDLSVLTSRSLPGEAFEVVADATIVVLVSEDTGWITNTRLRFELSRQSGALRIDSIRELALLTSQVEETSWGAIKCLYR